jgi:hypothetical protein
MKYKMENKILETWAPILKTYEIHTANANMIARYCDRHAKKESQHSIFSSESYVSTLPICIRILDKISLNNIQVVFTEDVPVSQVAVRESRFNGESNEDFMWRIDESIINRAVNVINDSLKDKQYLLLDILVMSIMTIAEGTREPSIGIKMKFNTN